MQIKYDDLELAKILVSKLKIAETKLDGYRNAFRAIAETYEGNISMTSGEVAKAMQVLAREALSDE